MPVAIHHVNIGLFWVNNLGQVVLKDTATLDSVVKATTQEHRVIPNLSGAGSTANSANYPTISEYLDAEANDDFAFAYMDQSQIITQQIT